MQSRKRARSRRGMVLITVIAAIAIAMVLLAGIGSLVASHFGREVTDSNYAKALDIAEAGVNYEFARLTQDTALADQFPGVTRSFGGGTYTAYCANRNGTTPWDGTQYLTVVATGTVEGVSRTIQVAAKGYVPEQKYAIYTMNAISIWTGSSATINGDVGTNGEFKFTATPTINGSLYFNGPNAGWVVGDPGIYTEYNLPKAITWPTVDDIANQMFPGGGLTWLSTHNDNLTKAVPPIINNSVTSATTLTAGNYYITYMNLAGSNTITFDNRLGPVNVWVGPAGATGTCRFRGGTGMVSPLADPSKLNHIYVATRSGIDLGGNQELDALVYAYNHDAAGDYGYATNSGNPHVVGQIMANKYDLNGNITIDYIKTNVEPTSFGYYGYDNGWLELGARS